jgi:phosphoglucan,water dikinase
MWYSQGPRSVSAMPEGKLIRIGNQTAYSAAALMAPFEFALDNGFDAFEWFPDKKVTGEGWLVNDISGDMRAQIRKTAEAHDLRLSVHAPWPSDPLLEADAAAFPDTVEFAEDLGASLLNIHLRSDRGPEAFSEALRPLLSLLRGKGIRLSVENTVYSSPSDFNIFFDHLRKFDSHDSPLVGMCLDIGHANLCSETRNDYLRFLDLLDDDVPIIHIHMHENYGDRDSHLTVFSGPAGKDPSAIEGLIRRLKKRNFSGSVIFEQWPEPKSLLLDARERLIQIIAKEDAPKERPVGPAPHDGTVERFAEANKQFGSWRKRLEWVGKLLEGPEKADLELLVYLAVYLRFLGTGEIVSSEEGGHHRPSHHARLSEQIYRRLAGIENEENTLVIRKIYPWLPSFDAEFLRAEPLTRIRDIAHRNDIPHELKQEIKTTLQNKLHRSAGPEDLATSGALLKKITSPGTSYPQPFLEEFRRFHKELKDFFNAGSLKEMLITLNEKGDIETPELISDFLGLPEAPGEKKGSPDQVIRELEMVTTLRRSVAPTGKIASAKEHRLRSADTRLEDHVFVLLSTIINSVTSSKDLPWDAALRVLALTIENLRLGSVAPEECRAVEAELEVWSADFAPRDRDSLLRLRATVERCRRVADEYSEKILALFPGKVNDLGNALGVSEHAVKTFSEAVIRSHPVFQLSRLIALLLKSIRTLAFLNPWEVIVPGEASGRLITVGSLASVTDEGDGPLVVLTEKAEGDEEIPTHITGLIIAGETPLLSHLAVRARQRGTVFVSCEDSGRIGELRKLTGKPIRICAAADSFETAVTEMKDSGVFKDDSVRVIVPEVSIEFPSEKIIALDMVSPATGGPKAYGAKRLMEIARLGEGAFEVPRGIVIPFGVMEESLHRNPSLKGKYHAMAEEIDRLPRREMEMLLQRLRELLLTLPLDNGLVSGIKSHFGKDDRFIVRSSSNCEDLEGLSGAGLYDSVLNVPQSAIASAVLKVWASLWNRRAVEARRNASVPHGRARMAVLIQKMMPAEMSFIMHTLNPLNNSESEILVELAAGLGETLASGREPGAPFRAVYRKNTGDTEMHSFASYSAALVGDSREGTVRKIIDYSKVQFSRDEKFRTELSARIGKTGVLTENSLGLPLDIEGCVVGSEIFLVQARPQQRRPRECRG